jgi:hypothetical protein
MRFFRIKNFYQQVQVSALVLLFLVVSCQKKDLQNWNTQLLSPVVNSTLTLNNLIADSLIQKNADSSISLVYRYVFQNISLDTILVIPDTTMVKSFTLQTIKLGTRKLTRDVTLGEVARQAGAIGQLILMNQNKLLPIPAITNQTTDPIDFDASNLFENVDVKKGIMNMSITNGFPIELTNVIYNLKNKNLGTELLRDTIPSLKSGKTYSKNFPLDGKVFESKLEGQIISFNSPGTGTTPVLIDTNKRIRIIATIIIDEVNSARAIFPAQNLIDKREDVTYLLDGPELTKMRVKTGSFKIKLASTLPDTAYVTYTIPDAKYFGIDPLYFSSSVPPAPPGQTIYVDNTYPVDNYYYDLRGKNRDTVNSFYNELLLRIDSTGKMISLSLKDSFYIYYSLYDVKPEYLEGYLGKNSYKYKSSFSGVDIFNTIREGNISLDDAKLKIFVENGVGADASITVTELKAQNTKKQLTQTLDLTSIGNPISISRATNNPLVPSYTSRELNKTNSNSTSLIEIFPNKFLYDFNVTINPNGNSANRSDFIYSSSGVKAGADIELPLYLSADNIALTDTLDFELNKMQNLDQVTSAVFTLIADNSFPLSATVQLWFADEKYKIFDSLFTPLRPVIMGGELKTGQQRVLVPAKTKIPASVDELRMQKIRNSRYVVVKASFNTVPKSQHLKFYSDYKLIVKLVAELSYKPKF